MCQHPLTGDAARRALSLADAAIQRLAAQVNPKITLSVLAAKLIAKLLPGSFCFAI